MNNLHRHYRIAQKQGFSLIMKSSRSSTEHFVIYSRPNDLHHPRLGVSVPKRIIKLSSDRNMVKRLVRECFRQFKITQNKDIVVHCRKEFLKQERASTRSELEKTLKSFTST
jgi:ribonuclease P protein component